jgi:hypothetical protein
MHECEKWEWPRARLSNTSAEPAYKCRVSLFAQDGSWLENCDVVDILPPYEHVDLEPHSVDWTTTPILDPSASFTDRDGRRWERNARGRLIRFGRDRGAA